MYYHDNPIPFPADYGDGPLEADARRQRSKDIKLRKAYLLQQILMNAKAFGWIPRYEKNGDIVDIKVVADLDPISIAFKPSSWYDRLPLYFKNLSIDDLYELVTVQLGIINKVNSDWICKWEQEPDSVEGRVPGNILKNKWGFKHIPYDPRYPIDDSWVESQSLGFSIKKKTGALQRSDRSSSRRGRRFKPKAKFRKIKRRHSCDCHGISILKNRPLRRGAKRAKAKEKCDRVLACRADKKRETHPESDFASPQRQSDLGLGYPIPFIPDYWAYPEEDACQDCLTDEDKCLSHESQQNRRRFAYAWTLSGNKDKPRERSEWSERRKDLLSAGVGRGSVLICDCGSRYADNKSIPFKNCCYKMDRAKLLSGFGLVKLAKGSRIKPDQIEIIRGGPDGIPIAVEPPAGSARSSLLSLFTKREVEDAEDGSLRYAWQARVLDRWKGITPYARNKKNRKIKLTTRSKYRGLVEAVTGAGKTRLCIGAIKHLLYEEKKRISVTIMVPTNALVGQWLENLKRDEDIGSRSVIYTFGESKIRSYHPDLTSWSEAEGKVVGRITPIKRNPKTILAPGSIAIMTYASAIDELECRVSIKRGVAKNFLILDEAHRATSASSRRVLGVLIGDHSRDYPCLKGKPSTYHHKYTLGVSATLPNTNDVDEDDHDALSKKEEISKRWDILEEQCGPLIAKYDLPRALAMQTISHFNLTWLYTAPTIFHEIDNDSSLAERALKREYSWMDPARIVSAYCLIKQALSQGKKVICFHKRVRPMNILYTLLFNDWMAGEVIAYPFMSDDYSFTSHTDEEYLIPFGNYHSKQPSQLRRKMMESFSSNKGRVRCMLSVEALLEGIDVPDTSIGIALAADRSKTKNIQAMGRILRRNNEEKDFVFIQLDDPKDNYEKKIYNQVVRAVGNTGEETSCPLTQQEFHDINKRIAKIDRELEDEASLAEERRIRKLEEQVRKEQEEKASSRRHRRRRRRF